MGEGTKERIGEGNTERRVVGGKKRDDERKKKASSVLGKDRVAPLPLLCDSAIVT